MSPPTPLFVDTNAFVAIFDEEDDQYERANAVLDGIRDGDLDYGPVFTSRYVLSETTTTLRYGVGHREAAEALETIRDSPTINVLDGTESVFARTVEQFLAYDDQEISFIDHLDCVLGEQYDVDHIFAFEEDFRTLGMTRVPVDTGELG